MATFPSISDVAAVDRDEILVLLEDGQLVRIGSGSIQKLETPKDSTARRFYFLNRDIGWILDSSGQLWMTENAGTDWQKSGNVQFDPKDIFGELRFVDGSVGWLTARGTLLTTKDGGNNWITSDTNTPVQDDRQYVQFPAEICAIDSTKAFVGMNRGKVLKTDNQGDSWQNVGLPADHEIRSAVCPSGDDVWVGTWSSGGLYHSADGGSTWQQVLPDKDREILGISSITFRDRDSVWLAGMHFVKDASSLGDSNGVVLASDDRGLTWSRKTGDIYDTPFRKVLFFDSENGWLVGEKIIYRTSDGGETWKILFNAP